MPHRRRVQKGSFGAHFDELVAHFPAGESALPRRPKAQRRPAELQEKIDIHALLFERAWEMNSES